MQTKMMGIVAAGLLWSLPAHATLLTVVYSGTIESGALASPSVHPYTLPVLAGDKFSTTYTFDTSLGGASYYPNAGADTINISQGPSLVSPGLGHSSFEIGSSQLLYNTYGQYIIENQIALSTGGFLKTSLIGPVYNQTFNFNLLSGTGTGIASVFYPISDQGDSLNLVLDVTSGTIVSSVPVPPALPMFAAALLGLLGIGYVKRRSGQGRMDAVTA